MFNRRARTSKGQLARYQRVNNDSNTPRVARVYYIGFKISELPLISSGYYNCNAVVLFGDKLAALSHYSKRYQKDINGYVEEMVMEMKKKGEDNLVAVIIGGDEEHFSKNAVVLRELGIPITNLYCDNYPEKCAVPVGDAEAKDLVVIPTTREVFMMTHKTRRFFNLSPYS